ncbi:enolase C-terminal domain-like protein [Lipomyces japonicus]|uniref:enolase C-terminal domain-like protein n=1 Tax=Lipomyces japonicus TaxID=56871 RepID=UPI0034CE6EFC
MSSKNMSSSSSSSFSFSFSTNLPDIWVYAKKVSLLCFWTATASRFPKIVAVRTFLIDSSGIGGDYHNVERGHWLIDNDILNPMSRYEKYRASRVSWGINVLGSFCIELEADDGTIGFATGFGGPPACWLVKHHFERFIIGVDPRDYNLLWEQLFRASMFYGRKGLTIAYISVIDLALWDLLGKIRNEPVLLPFGPDEGHIGLQENVEFLRQHREAVGSDFPLMDLNINWFEEVLHPDDFDGFMQLRAAVPWMKWTTGEHEYTKYGFRKLIENRAVDILQPDVMWLGSITELVKLAAQAAAYDIPVVPHASGPYSYHFVASQNNTPFQEYLANSPDSKSVLPVFGGLFTNEPIPSKGYLDVTVLDRPGFGLEVNPRITLIPADHVLSPSPQKPLVANNDDSKNNHNK